MSETKFDSWGLIELFGHARVAGRITEQSVGGCNFVRVDVPTETGFYTRLLGQGAIYAINLTTEDVARQLAKRHCEEPTFAYGLQPTIPKLQAAQHNLQLGDGNEEDRDPEDIPW